MGYNRIFNIDLNEMEVIERALQKRLAELTEKRQSGCQDTCTDSIDDEVKMVQNLLGSFHNQKIWYRPRNKVYISG